MDMAEYQGQALVTASYPDIGKNLTYTTLGLAGEAGELANKVKKLVREKGYRAGEPFQLSDADFVAIQAELGDCLWYIAATCHEIGTYMSMVAIGNLAKLGDRKVRGLIDGNGDDR